LVVELCEAIKASEPRIVPLVRIVEGFEREMEKHFGKSVEEMKKTAIHILMGKIYRYNSDTFKVTENGLAYIENNDTIMVHTASAGVINMLVRAGKDHNKDFRVLVLKQDLIKTKQLIHALGNAEIEHIVVPEYDLSHVIGMANKMFIGGLAVTSDRKVVTAVGTANIVSLCHLNQVPIYLFINTFKFSKVPSSDQRIHKKEEIISKGDYSYQLTTYSHDLVDFELIDHMITEYGEMNRIFYEKFFY
jgi:translation initiation factor 2B subunit (eIF-2B alpha/beta/delta family)